jgi:glucose-6-phosphate 1-dehydrogenase
MASRPDEPARVAGVNPLRDPRTSGCRGSPGPCGLVLFGVTGDLARKKLMPAIYDLANRGLLPPGFALVGFARRDWADRTSARSSTTRSRTPARPFREEVWRVGSPRASGSCRAPSTTTRLRPAGRDRARARRERGTGGNHAFYLSIPPGFFAQVCQQLERSGLARPDGAALAPGGHREAVRARPGQRPELNAIVESVFPADSVFRIDHYLGKETVQNLLALRFANQLFEPVWNANYVDHVQITMAEDIGIGGRAGYYDGIGAARDVIQNHLLQLLALTAMEEPVSFDARQLRAEKEKVLAAVGCPRTSAPPRAGSMPRAGRAASRSRLPPGGGRRARLHHRDVCRDPPRGRHPPLGRGAVLPAHRQAPGQAGHRDRGGLQAAPHLPFDDTATEELGQNAIVIRVQPDEGITMRFGAKVPGPRWRSAT